MPDGEVAHQAALDACLHEHRESGQHQVDDDDGAVEEEVALGVLPGSSGGADEILEPDDRDQRRVLDHHHPEIGEDGDSESEAEPADQLVAPPAAVGKERREVVHAVNMGDGPVRPIVLILAILRRWSDFENGSEEETARIAALSPPTALTCGPPSP